MFETTNTVYRQRRHRESRHIKEKTIRLRCKARGDGGVDKDGVMDVIEGGQRQPCRQHDREGWTACFGIKRAGREAEVGEY